MVDVSAIPGSSIYTTENRYYNDYYRDYDYVSGTSFSAPYAAGIAALARSLNDELNASDFFSLIKAYINGFGFNWL
ncbi:hypothetical protein MASR1M31_21610 [Porphyromonadaceae bacterium]